MKTNELTAVALSLLALSGCKTTLNGGGNDGGGNEGGGDSADLAANVSTATAGSTGSTGAGGTFVTSSASGGTASSGSGACPSIDGVPYPTELLETDDFFYEAHANETSLYLTTEAWIEPPDPATLMEVDKESGTILDETAVDSVIEALTEHEGVLYGAGRCIAGGDPYRIELPGPTFEALAPGCESNPTRALAAIGGGIAYGTHDGQTSEVRWVPTSGEGPVRVLATYPPIEDAWGPFIVDIATDDMAIYPVLSYSAFLDSGGEESWGEIWRVPLDGSAPTHVVSTIPEPGLASGITSVVVDADSVYFNEIASGTIWRIGSGGGEATLLWQGTNQAIQLVEVGSDLAFYDLTVPFPSSCEVILRRLPKVGGEAVAVAVLPNFPAWQTLTSDGSDFFFTGQDSRRISDDQATYPTMLYRAPINP